MPVVQPPVLGETPRVTSVRRRAQPPRSVPPYMASPEPRDDEAQLVEDLLALIESGRVLPIRDGAAVRYAAADEGEGGWS